MSPFVGAGLTAGYSRETLTIDAFPCYDFDCPDVPVGAESRLSRASVGVGAILGAEVRVARGVTLGAAYTLGVSVDRVAFEEDRPFGGRDEGTSTSVSGGTGLTNLQLSVYF